jgi:tetratricopeptide (TPR) repeat protein
VLRRAIGLCEGEAPHVAREKILANTRGLPSADRVAYFLGELTRTPFADDADVALREARRSPEVLASQIDQAFVAFAERALDGGPLLVILEDVHRADAASLRLFATLMARARDRPLMVLALARPTIDDVHPGLWADLRCQRVVLEPLLRKACERLARALIGDRPDIDRIVKRAEGNALFVEELARACAEGRSIDELPPTVLAAAEARVGALDADTRHMLRAAAIFGERFWEGGVAKLLGRTNGVRVDRLEELEIVSRSRESRFAGEREYLFRHALVREAAYGMLTDEDRRIGHALAGEWLEAFATGDEMADALAMHFEQAGLWTKAARESRRAADRAIRLGRFSEGLVLLDRAKDWLDRASRGDAPDAPERRSALVELLLEQERVCDLKSDRTRQEAVLGELLSMLVPGRDDGVLATVHARRGELLALSGRADEAERCLDLALEISRAANDPARERIARKAIAFLAWQQARYEDAVAENQRVVDLARATRDPGYGRDVVNLGMSLVRIGAMDRARACLDEIGTLQGESPRDMVHAHHFRSLYFSKLGDADAEIDAHRECLALQEQHGLWPYKLITLDALAGALRRHGRRDEAALAYEELGRVARLIDFRPQLAKALGCQADVLVELGRVAEAIALYGESHELFEKIGDLEGAALTLERAARASRSLSDPSLAAHAYERAALAARRAGDRRREGDLLNTLGILHFNAGRHRRALDVYERSLAAFTGSDALADRVHRALLHNSIAATLHRMGEHAAAREQLTLGLALARETGEQLLETHALALLAKLDRQPSIEKEVPCPGTSSREPSPD